MTIDTHDRVPPRDQADEPSQLNRADLDAIATAVVQKVGPAGYFAGAAFLFLAVAVFFAAFKSPTTIDTTAMTAAVTSGVKAAIPAALTSAEITAAVKAGLPAGSTQATTRVADARPQGGCPTGYWLGRNPHTGSPWCNHR